jgi:hypothetical protein
LATRLVLHIGSMKSGTSFIQNVLGHNKERLEADGVSFPGPRWRFQVRAVRQLIGYGGEGQAPMPEKGPWRSLVDEINAWPGLAVVSMEFLGPRPEAKIAQILADFPDTPVEAVLTCRDLGRTIPAMWQEAVQNGGITAWPDYLDAVRHRRSGDRVSRGFWKHQDIPAIAARWSTALGPERFTLVTLPQPGADPGLLWRRFADAAGFEHEDCELDVRSNPSIGLASAQVLLRLNQAYHREHGAMPPYYDPYVKHKLAKRGLVGRSGDEPRLGLDARWVVRLGEAQIERLQKAGHRVVGDLFDLRPVPVEGAHTDDVTTEEQLDAAIAGIARALSGWAGSDREHRRTLRDLEKR